MAPQDWGTGDIPPNKEGIRGTVGVDIIKIGADIIKNPNILSKTAHLLSKIQIYYQKLLFTATNTHYRIDRYTHVRTSSPQ
jgi:hypothetical protein